MDAEYFGFPVGKGTAWMFWDLLYRQVIYLIWNVSLIRVYSLSLSLCGNRAFLCSQKSGSLERPFLGALGKLLLLLPWLGWWPLLYFSGRLCWRWVAYNLCSRFIVLCDFTSILVNERNRTCIIVFKTFRWRRKNSLVSVFHFKFPVQIYVKPVC